MDFFGPLADFADRYDEAVKNDIKRFDDLYYRKNEEVALEHGAGSWQAKNYLVATTTLYGLYMASQMIAQGVLDTFRFGRGMKEGGWGYAADGLRLLSIFGAVAKIGGKAIPPLLARLAASGGGPSCAPTAIVFAARLSATRLFLTMRDVRRILKLPMSPYDPKFPGIYFNQVIDALVKVGAKVRRSTPGGWQDIAKLAEANQGPVIFEFSFQKPGAVMGVREYHVMTAYKQGGALMVADQNGVRTAAAFHDLMRAKSMSPIYLDALLVEDGAFVPTVTKLANAALGAGAGGVISMEWLESALAISAWEVDHDLVVKLAGAARDQLLGADGGDRPSPNARAVLAAARGPLTTGLAVQVASGIGDAGAFMAAVRELELRNRVRVSRRALGSGTPDDTPASITSITPV